jgi:hypothetical protein
MLIIIIYLLTLSHFLFICPATAFFSRIQHKIYIYLRNRTNIVKYNYNTFIAAQTNTKVPPPQKQHASQGPTHQPGIDVFDSNGCIFRYQQPQDLTKTPETFDILPQILHRIVILPKLQSGRSGASTMSSGSLFGNSSLHHCQQPTTPIIPTINFLSILLLLPLAHCHERRFLSKPSKAYLMLRDSKRRGGHAGSMPTTSGESLISTSK